MAQKESPLLNYVKLRAAVESNNFMGGNNDSLFSGEMRLDHKRNKNNIAYFLLHTHTILYTVPAICCLLYLLVSNQLKARMEVWAV